MSYFWSFPGVGAALVLGLGVLHAFPAAAQDPELSRLAPSRAPKPAPLAPPVGFRVFVAHASEEKDGGVDPECAIMQKRLPMKFPTIRAVHRRDYWMGFGEQISIPLEGTDASVQLIPVSIHKRQLFMQVQLPGKIDTRVRVKNGKPVILAGIAHNDGGLLIIQVEPDFGRYLADPNSFRPMTPHTVRVNTR